MMFVLKIKIKKFNLVTEKDKLILINVIQMNHDILLRNQVIEAKEIL